LSNDREEALRTVHRMRFLRPAILFAVAGATALSPSTASAHMGAESSTPGNAETVQNAPEQATITFNADVEIGTATASIRRIGDIDTPITEALGRRVPTERLERLEATGRTVVFDLPDLGAGMYAIDWAVNEAGGHPNSAFILFIVTGDSGGSPVVLYVFAAGFVLVVGAAAYVVVRRRRAA
jgi:methionine-rich copper-binding protein CopC